MPAAALIEAEGLAAGYDGALAISGVEFSLRAGQTLALLGPNGGGKTTLLRALLGELPPLAGTLRVAATCGTVPQTERSRLDYPVSALDVATMGTLPRLPWWRRPGRREREAAARGARPRRPAGARRADLRPPLRRPAPARPDRPGPGPGRRRAAARRALLRPRPAQRRGPGSADRRAGGGGARRSSSPPTTSSRRAACDLVLCINKRQVACGPPDQVLEDLGVLEATYGGAIVEIPGGGGRAILPPHHHHH